MFWKDENEQKEAVNGPFLEKKRQEKANKQMPIEDRKFSTLASELSPLEKLPLSSLQLIS